MYVRAFARNGARRTRFLLCRPGGVSGPEFVKEIKDRHSAVKFAFMTGYADDEARKSGLVGSEHVVLTKPFRLRELADVVGGALSDDAGAQLPG